MTEKEFINKVNEDFAYFIKAIPFVEIDNNVIGKTHKLRCQISDIDNGIYSIADVFFELQWLLYRYKEKKEVDNCKLIVSNLILSPEIPNYAFRRGFIIKMKYE